MFTNSNVNFIGNIHIFFYNFGTKRHKLISLLNYLTEILGETRVMWGFLGYLRLLWQLELFGDLRNFLGHLGLFGISRDFWSN